VFDKDHKPTFRFGKIGQPRTKRVSRALIEARKRLVEDQGAKGRFGPGETEAKPPLLSEREAGRRKAGSRIFSNVVLPEPFGPTSPTIPLSGKS